MSHRASNWLAELPADAMSASSFRVLFHLANAHNSLREPAEACFPQQSALLKATGLSNGGLNNALNGLEASGLIRRLAATDHDGRRRTYYILGCDFGLLEEQTPKNGVSPNSNLEATKLQSGGGANSNSVEFDTKAEPVREPVREPVIREEGLFPDLPKPEAPLGGKTPDHWFDEFWSAYPTRAGASKKNAKAKFLAALKLAKPEDLIRAASAYAKSREREDEKYTKHAEFWLSGQFWETWLAEPEIDPERARLQAITAAARAAARPQIGRS